MGQGAFLALKMMALACGAQQHTIHGRAEKGPCTSTAAHKLCLEAAGELSHVAFGCRRRVANEQPRLVFGAVLSSNRSWGKRTADRRQAKLVPCPHPTPCLPMPAVAQSVAELSRA
jgi:hypothetical protein